MKVYFCIIAALACVSACQNTEIKKTDLYGVEKDTARFTSITWIDSVKNIGTVEPGKKTEIKFRFKNSGSKPLFIISAVPGCGCTVADYPKEAIAPGAEGEITAAYDVKTGTTGDFRKSIHITTNTNGSTDHDIYFYGAIKSAADTTTRRRVDTALLNSIRSKELKKNLLLKPTKN